MRLHFSLRSFYFHSFFLLSISSRTYSHTWARERDKPHINKALSRDFLSPAHSRCSVSLHICEQQQQQHALLCVCAYVLRLCAAINSMSYVSIVRGICTTPRRFFPAAYCVTEEEDDRGRAGGIGARSEQAMRVCLDAHSSSVWFWRLSRETGVTSFGSGLLDCDCCFDARCASARFFSRSTILWRGTTSGSDQSNTQSDSVNFALGERAAPRREFANLSRCELWQDVSAYRSGTRRKMGKKRWNREAKGHRSRRFVMSFDNAAWVQSWKRFFCLRYCCHERFSRNTLSKRSFL